MELETVNAIPASPINPVAAICDHTATGLFANSVSLAGERTQNDMATNLMSGREKSETDFRQSIFEPLIKQIFNDSASLEKRYAEFELFQNNFNDLFNSRSIYDLLWNAAEDQFNVAVHKLFDNVNQKSNETCNETG